LPRNGDTVAMLAQDAEAGYWLGLVMSISTAHHALEVRYYELYDGSDDRYYLDTNGRIHSCSTECILGTIELCSVGSNCFVVDDCDHTILTQLVAESQRFRREQRVSARSRAANVRVAELHRRSNEGYEWQPSRRSTSSRALGVARGAAMTPYALRTTEQNVGPSRGSACCLTLALYRPFAGPTRPAVLVFPLSFPLRRSGLLFIHIVEPLFRLGMEAGSGAIGSWRVYRDGRHV